MASPSDIILEIGSKITKPATERGAAKTQYTGVLDGVLFIVNIDDTLNGKMVSKDGKTMNIPASKLIKAQSVYLKGNGQDFAVAKYVTIKDVEAQPQA